MALLRSWFASGLLAGFALAVVELVAVGSAAPDLVIVVLTLLGAVGFAVGLALWLPEILGVGHEGPITDALVRALPAALPLIRVARHLFDGAHAATLPGAQWAPVWIPVLGTLVIALAILIGRRILRSGDLLRRRVVAALLLVSAGWLEIGNRTLYQSEYPDVHLFLIVVVCAMLAVAIGLLARAPRADAPTARHVLAWSLSTAILGIALVAALAEGLAERSSRARLAADGSHARHLVRVVRAAVDQDRDGYAPVLGGGDCDDADPATNPGAHDPPGDRLDQDCDGVDPEAPPPSLTPADPAVDPVLAWRTSPARAALVARTRELDVLLISIDALRADALGRGDSPRLDALIAGAARFPRAFAPGSGTDVSLGGVATGRVDPWTRVDVTLAEVLAAGGWHTHAVLPGEVLRYAGRTLLARGFAGLDEISADHEARDVASATSAVETTDRVLAALDRAGSGARAAVWAHYFDVHEHGQVPTRDPELRKVAGARDLSTRRGRYAALVALVDREVGRLLDGLAARGRAGRTIVILFGDHGESLGEDDRLPEYHGRFVYEPLVRIPLAIAVPGVPPGEQLAPVSLLDLPATVLDLTDQAALADGFGRSLAPLFAPGADAVARGGFVERALPLHDSEQWGVVRWPLKLVARPADNLFELYDLERDPGERDDLAVDRRAEVAALKSLHAAFPRLDFDRTIRGRERREALARPPRRP